MKKVYRVGDDIFIAMAFVSFVVGIFLKLLGITEIAGEVSTPSLLFFALACLLFSIALSLFDLARRGE